MSDSVLFDAFLSKHPQVRFIHLQWLDYTSTLRGRVFPVRNVREMLATEQTHRLGGLNMCRIDNVAPSTQNDASGSVGGPVGQGRLVPDLVSIRLCPGLEGHASIFCNFVSVSVDFDEANSEFDPAQMCAFCPWKALQRVVARAEEMGLS